MSEPEGPNEPERRLVAILVADVVGFSRMLGEDETATLASLKHARARIIDPALTTFRGRIFKEMGDGLIVEFPSAVLALRAAMQIQAELADFTPSSPRAHRIALRIGVHQGEVLVIGSDLIGDGVNIAARLEPLAPAGGICVSHRVREDVAGKLLLEFEDLGEKTLKNIAQPVRVHRIHVRNRDLQDATATVIAPPPREAHASPPASRHWLILPQTEGMPGQVGIGPDPLTVGRIAPSDLILAGPDVSRQHCRIALVGDVAVVTDLNSTNGTYLNDERITRSTPMADESVLRVGGHMLTYRREEAEFNPELTLIAPSRGG